MFLLRGTSGHSLLPIGWELGTWRHVAHPPSYLLHPFPLVNLPPFSHPRADLCGNLVRQVYCTDWLILLSGHRLRVVHHQLT